MRDYDSSIHRCRPGNSRASGTARISYAREERNEEFAESAFTANEKLEGACAVSGFVYDQHKKPWIVEVSYGLMKEGYDPCKCYSNCDLNWRAGPFHPYGYMVGLLVRDLRQDL